MKLMDFQTLGNEWETVAIDRSLRGLSSDHTCVCVCVCVSADTLTAGTDSNHTKQVTSNPVHTNSL